ITGKLPFESEAIGDLLMKIMQRPLPVPSKVAPDVPIAFDAWWSRAAARSVDERFQSARELADRLSEALGVVPATTRFNYASDRVSAPNVSIAVSSKGASISDAVGLELSRSPPATRSGLELSRSPSATRSGLELSRSPSATRSGLELSRSPSATRSG